MYSELVLFRSFSHSLSSGVLACLGRKCCECADDILPGGLRKPVAKGFRFSGPCRSPSGLALVHNFGQRGGDAGHKTASEIKQLVVSQNKGTPIPEIPKILRIRSPKKDAPNLGSPKPKGPRKIRKTLDIAI